MSAAVRAALAAKRAEHRSRSSSPTKPSPALPNDDSQLPHFGRDLDASIASPFGSPKPSPRSITSLNANRSSASPTPAMDLTQKSEDDIVRLSIQNGRINLSSRSPSLQQVPPVLLSLLADEPPAWFLQIPEDDRQPWYMREEVHTMQLSNNELQSLPDEMAEFRGLKRLELHSNKLIALPPTFLQLSALTNLTLAKNGLTAFPACLLALDNLVTLDLSHNKIQTFWSDELVGSARSEREAWDKDNAAQENGVWAGLSPSKKDRKLLVADPDAHVNTPMRSLRSLDLSYNRISNASLGIPDLAKRRGGPSDVSDDISLVRLPTSLRTLNLGHNSIRGPVSATLFQHLVSLEDLGLQGCGIGDDVLAAHDIANGSSQVLSHLSILNLSGCELDDLTKIEAFFGSRRIQSFDQAIGNVDPAPSTQDPQTPAAGIPARQLVRVLNRPTSADITKMEGRCKARVLCLLLEGNPLREEAFRQKRGGRSASPEKKSATPATLGSKTAVSIANAQAASSPAASTPPTNSTIPATVAGVSQLPPKPQIVKEDWEILAESGLNTELGRRKLRIEQARREQQAAAAAKATEGPVSEDAQGRGRKPRVADEAVSSDPEVEGSSGESRERATSHHRGESIDDKDIGSALANAKLSSKKKEALGQVPCKFFRSNGCSAGASCPFAHTLPGDGGQKSVCQWFLKGSCRFGHKCALAHVLPGQPMSMDRKNKRAAQHGQPLPQAPNSQQQQQMVGLSAGVQASQPATLQSGPPKAGQMPHPTQRQVSAQQVQQQVQMASQLPLQSRQGTPNRNDLVPAQANTSLGSQMHNRKASFTTRDHDLPFGMPDDFQTSAPATAAPSNAMDPARAGFEGAQDPSFSTSFTGSTSFRRPSTLSQSLSASLAAQSFGGTDSAAAAFGTSASRAFGTSPFSHPSGHALFFSGSQDDEGGAGPFSRGNRDHFGARSTGRTDDAAKAWGGISSGATSRPIGGSRVEEEMEDAEDFLPSSLSDLLTPAELERRRRSNRLSSSFAGNDERVTVAQSMPSQAAPAFGSSLGFGRSAIGAERAKSSNLSAGFQQQQQHHGRGEEFSPFGSGRPTSGLDSIAFREGTSGLSTSASRTAAYHAPGQSLPQGLAAGLSRLHLRTGRSGDSGSQHVGAGIAPIGGGASNADASSPAIAFSPQNSQPSNGAAGGLRVPGSLDDYGLGPTAPSSVLPHRSPLSFAVGSAGVGGIGGHRLSGSFAERQLGNGTFGSPGSGSVGSPFSPSLSAIGSHRVAGVGAGEGGIAIPEGGAQKHATGTGTARYAQHPATHRLRAGSSAAAPHSPLTLPVVTAEEDEEEAIFELE
ncbi:adenylate cyclase fragment [Pseudozyma hubeiensis SY62]|uniref:Adenylate cyclase n=1 Tax=Pseudozyma hubeiensis (strain SY62) TaxID=1305764 RepID=R9PHI8_PSEHS|nr:adenylate cyclase fragment [Pseudozyma hubeiensis SY62]GAC97580.1 adenylate cyclase fragment [Pseudozyma hubeiensis SY62]